MYTLFHEIIMLSNLYIRSLIFTFSRYNLEIDQDIMIKPEVFADHGI